MVAPKPKKHHFVPQFYLREFYDEQKRLHVFDRVAKRYREYSSTKGIAYEVGYYFIETADEQESTQIEEALGVFESKARPVMQKLVARNDIEQEERVALAAYIALQSQRVPHTEKRIREASEKMHLAITKEYARRQLIGKNIPDKMTATSPFSTPEEIDAYIIKAIDEGRIKVATSKNNVIKLMMESAAQLEVGFFNNDWIVLHAPKDALFITSDNPVANIGKGWLSENSLKLFPINPRAALLIGNSGKPSIYHKKASREDVRRINDAVAERSDRYIIANSEKLLKSIVHRTKVDTYLTESRADVQLIRNPTDSNSTLFILDSIGPDMSDL